MTVSPPPRSSPALPAVTDSSLPSAGSMNRMNVNFLICETFCPPYRCLGTCCVFCWVVAREPRPPGRHSAWPSKIGILLLSQLRTSRL